MWVAGVPSLLTARTRRRKGGFCPDNSASELPAVPTTFHKDLRALHSPAAMYRILGEVSIAISSVVTDTKA